MTYANKLTYSVAEAMEVIGIGRTNLYRLSGARVLRPRKIGNRTVFLVEDVNNYIANLPEARLRPDPRRSAPSVHPRSKRSSA